MIAEKNTLFLAYNKDKSIVHQGYVFKGQAMDIGLPNKEYFTTKISFETRLKELRIENETDFEEWIEPPIDYTPPTLSNIGVIIPEKFEWVFANDRFEINGFVVDFARVNGQLAVDVAYLAWEAFQQELDLPTNATVKASLMPIWRHVETEFELGKIIKL